MEKQGGRQRARSSFSPNAEGVSITETLEMLSESGKHVLQISYTDGKATPQVGSGIDTSLVVKADRHRAYLTAQAKGLVVSQLQVILSGDGKRMIFRYLWNAADPTGRAFDDRYLYEKQ